MRDLCSCCSKHCRDVWFPLNLSQYYGSCSFQSFLPRFIFWRRCTIWQCYNVPLWYCDQQYFGRKLLSSITGNRNSDLFINHYGIPSAGNPWPGIPHPSPLPGPSGSSLKRNHPTIPSSPCITSQTLEHLQYYRLYTGYFTANPPPNLYNKSVRWVSLDILNWGNWDLEQPHRLSEPGLQR